jgi:hypothetical protein
MPILGRRSQDRPDHLSAATLDGGRECVELNNYPIFIAENREQEFQKAGLRIDRKEQVSDFGSYWLCTPSSRWSAGSEDGAQCEVPAPESSTPERRG